MEFKMNIYGLLILIAGLLAVVSFFVTWSSPGTVTGLDLMKFGGDFKAYIPLIVLILGIIAILFAMFEFMGISFDALVQKIIVLVLGVIVLILPLVMMEFKFTHVGFGFWLAVVSGLLLIVFPLLVLLKVLPEE